MKDKDPAGKALVKKVKQQEKEKVKAARKTLVQARKEADLSEWGIMKKEHSNAYPDRNVAREKLWEKHTVARTAYDNARGWRGHNVTQVKQFVKASDKHFKETQKKK